MILVLPFENIHVSQNAEWKTQTQQYRVVQIRERMTVDLETTLILKKKIIRPIRSLFRKKRKIYRFLQYYFEENYFLELIQI